MFISVTFGYFFSGAYGSLANSFVATTGMNWGFEPREIETKKVIVSYGEKDVQSPPEHGMFLVDLFQKKEGVECKVNVGKNGHDSFMFEFASGAFVREIVSM